MQYNNKPGMPTLRAWGVPCKPSLRERVVDVARHLLVLTLLLMFISVIQTVTAAA